MLLKSVGNFLNKIESEPPQSYSYTILGYMTNEFYMLQKSLIHINCRFIHEIQEMKIAQVSFNYWMESKMHSISCSGMSFKC